MEIIFLSILLVIALVGVLSSRSSRFSLKDYFLTSHTLSPWLAGISAMATNNSGYMFIGLIGFTFINGISSLWLMLGWIMGDLLITHFIYPPLLKVAHHSDNVTYASIIAEWAKNKSLIKPIAMISFIFLIIYASAQLAASGKTLMVVMGWDFVWGVLIGGIIVILYTISGGIRASIWTDSIQAIIMTASLIILLIFAVNGLGGIDTIVAKWQKIDGFLKLFPDNDSTLIYQFFSSLSWIIAGIFVISQPHIVVRFLSLKETVDLKSARHYYYFGYIIFYSLAFMAGMIARVYFNDNVLFDPELALPMMAVELLNPFMLGLIVAGIFAATMSTADSMIINCSGNIGIDLMGLKNYAKNKIKIITLIIAVSAILIALIDNANVFSVVVFSWTVLGFIFTPVIIMIALSRKITLKHFYVCSLLALVIFCIKTEFNYFNDIYSGLPPFIFSLLYYQLLLKKSN